MTRTRPGSPRARLLALLGAALVAVGVWGPAGATPRKGADSGLPLPRYESTSSKEVHGRRGPGLDYRIDWVYRVRGLPVRVLQEDNVWRLVRDPAGGEVWIHSKLLSPNRTVMVKSAPRPGLALKAAAREDAATVAWLEPGLVAALKACSKDWRRVSIPGKVEGWVQAGQVWGGDDCALPR